MSAMVHFDQELRNTTLCQQFAADCICWVNSLPAYIVCCNAKPTVLNLDDALLNVQSVCSWKSFLKTGFEKIADDKQHA